MKRRFLRFFYTLWAGWRLSAGDLEEPFGNAWANGTSWLLANGNASGLPRPSLVLVPLNQQGQSCCNYSTRIQIWVRPMNKMEPRISSFLPPSMTVTLAL